MISLYHSDLLIQPNAPYPNEVAIVDGTRPVTIACLFDKSKRLAIGMKSRGFKKNDIVLITLPPGESFLVVVYAVAMLRGRVAIIDPEMGKIHFAAKLRQLSPSWAFVDSRLIFLRDHRWIGFLLHKIKRNVPEIVDIENCVVIATGMWVPTFERFPRMKELLKSDQEVEFIQDHSDHDFLIIYTSGTIHEPKGVVHSFKGLASSIDNLRKLIEAKPGDVLGTGLPHYMMLGIAAKIPVSIFSTSASPRVRIREIEQKRVTLLFGAPSEYLPLIKYCEITGKKLPSCLRKVFFGSAPVHTTFLRKFFIVAPVHLETICLYGMTELLICAFIKGQEKLTMKTQRGDVLGKLVDDVECRIGPDGEILLRSPQLFSRYFHAKGKSGFHATGDSGFLDDQCNLVLTGRKKDMIIRKNFNIYPAIYETIIRNIAGVDECAVVGIWSDQKEDEEIYLVVEGDRLKLEKIRNQLAYGPNAIQKEAWPDQIVQMPIPRNGKHEKVDKKKLRELLSKRRFDVALNYSRGMAIQGVTKASTHRIWP